MNQYTRGLAEVGANVLGVGDQPLHAVPEATRRYLADYLQVPAIMREDDVIARVHAWLRGRSVDRIETQWEPLVILAARMRERFGVPGMSVDTVIGFRDKEIMKQRVKAAGLRVPYSFRARTEAEVRAAAERVGFPLIIKPIAGAGSADTYRVDDAAELNRIIKLTQHVQEVSVEEFVDGEEFTFDTVCVDGRPQYANIAQYLPRPLVARSIEHISPVIITVKDMWSPPYQQGIELGLGVLKALNMGTGFTHMEWYKKSNGEVVFGEIGCRPGGAHLVDQMNFTGDIDLFREWARAVCWKSFEATNHRKYNVAIIFKRARGQGRITRVEGVEHFMRRYGLGVVWNNLLPVGANRRNWKQTLVSDGFMMLRHPDWDATRHMADRVAEDITLYAE
jgi:biotin carboxylase